MVSENGSADPSGITVGVVANPASGRDIRRLVAGASVFDNAEKGNMVYRLMAGLGSLGVGRMLMMPAASGLYDSLEKNIRTHGKGRRLPELELVEMMVWHGAQDSVTAVEAMVERGVSAIAVLGGDGTSRVVAQHCGDIPLIPLSTGTNNAFPEMREATVAGLALGLLVTGRIAADRVLKHQKVLYVGVNGKPRQDLALVDVAASSERFVGARALWKPGTVTELVVAAAAPDAVGLSSVAGLLDPVARDAPHGLYLKLSGPDRAGNVLNVPLSPGLIEGIGVREYRRIEAGEAVELDGGFGSIALDGEREIERGERDTVTVTLELDGPRTLDVRETMRIAAEEGLLRE
ncbi:NAD(+)/NADH kinase [Rubrobacter indicoceani]|uniref:NAD(+)/NADH kinase n=1 Tax=Rubrobacter indicoceani TaxID=2051957 RepID=UPI001F09CF5E|nr:NAD(+)/NADH kinase [Rubrobacter indicoceani]